MARSKGQPGVLIFWELFDVLEALPGDDAKNMLSAIRGYIQRGAIPDFGDRQALTYLWLVVQPKLDADTERYEKKREQCHDAVMARWEKERQKAAAEDSKSIRSYTDESERIRKIPTTTTSTSATTTTSTSATKKDCMGVKPQRAKRTTSTKHKYGEYKNVLLTNEEFEKLKVEFADYTERIERLSAYVASTGKSYKSHYATIRNWARTEDSNGNRRNQSHSVDREKTQRSDEKWGITYSA